MMSVKALYTGLSLFTTYRKAAVRLEAGPEAVFAAEVGLEVMARNPAAEGCQEVEVVREPVFVPVLESGYALVPVLDRICIWPCPCTGTWTCPCPRPGIWFCPGHA